MQLPTCSTENSRVAPSLEVVPSSSISHVITLSFWILALPFVISTTPVNLKQEFRVSVMTIFVAPGLEMFLASSSNRSSNSASSGVIAT